MQRAARSWNKGAQPCDAESELSRGRPSLVAAAQKDPHKHLPSKFWAAAPGGAGEQKRRQWSQGQARDWRHCCYAEIAAADIDAPNTAKARRTAQRHADPLDTPKPTPWTLHGPSERDPAPSARTQASAADQENVAGP